MTPSWICECFRKFGVMAKRPPHGCEVIESHKIDIAPYLRYVDVRWKQDGKPYQVRMRMIVPPRTAKGWAMVDYSVLPIGICRKLQYAREVFERRRALESTKYKGKSCVKCRCIGNSEILKANDIPRWMAELMERKDRIHKEMMRYG